MEVRLYVRRDEHYKFDNDFETFGKVIFSLLHHDRIRAAWLQSPYLFDDLEMIYSCHMLSQEEWKKTIPGLYHPLIK